MPAKGQPGPKHDEETRKRISEAVKRAYDEGRLIHWKTGRHDLPGPFKGRQHTEETKAKISANRKGKGLGNSNGFKKGDTPWNKGKPHPVHNAEWRAKVSAATSGPNHWNWQHGQNSFYRLMRNSAKHKEWARAVHEKCNWTCQECGYRGRQLVAHHIVHWSIEPDLRFDVDNGVTLCRKCHCALHTPRLGTGKPPMRQL